MADMAEIIENSLEVETTQASTPKSKRVRNRGKTRGQARPYKKYDLLNLEGKIGKMRKQITLQRSRLLLLEDKLERHEYEISIRAQETAPAAASTEFVQ